MGKKFTDLIPYTHIFLDDKGVNFKIIVLHKL